MRQAVLNRYGFGYVPANNPPLVDSEGKPLYPDARPLYIGGDFKPEEHGEWCLAKCVYPANEQRIREIMDAA